LSAKSSVIVEGTVSKVLPTRWNTDEGKEPDAFSGNDMIYQDTIINVSSVLKGEISANQPIIVRTYGGEYQAGKNIKAVLNEDSYGKFSEGENVILFLILDDTNYNRNHSTNYYILTGMNQGKYLINGNEVKNPHGPKDKNTLLDTISKHKNETMHDQYPAINSDL
ncbi:MAG: hypothetical protein ACYCX4_17430, partial [Bacillota bacterium]